MSDTSQICRIHGEPKRQDCAGRWFCVACRRAGQWAARQHHIEPDPPAPWPSGYLSADLSRAERARQQHQAREDGYDPSK